MCNFNLRSFHKVLFDQSKIVDESKTCFYSMLSQVLQIHSILQSGLKRCAYTVIVNGWISKVMLKMGYKLHYSREISIILLCWNYCLLTCPSVPHNTTWWKYCSLKIESCVFLLCCDVHVVWSCIYIVCVFT